MRGLWAALILMFLATPLAAQVESARYVEPTDRYGHGAVAAGEHGALEVTLTNGARVLVRVSDGVFEDTAPRLHDFDADGTPEIVTVFSGDRVGAMIRIYALRAGQLVARATSRPIGTRHRWLAIAGIADFNGDGLDEVAYVDRPHLARRLRLLSVDLTGPDGVFTELASVGGLSNHKYGSPEIEGGVRECDNKTPVVVTASANWSRVIETHLQGNELKLTNVGAYQGPESLSARLGC